MQRNKCRYCSQLSPACLQRKLGYTLETNSISSREAYACAAMARGRKLISSLLRTNAGGAARLFWKAHAAAMRRCAGK